MPSISTLAFKIVADTSQFQNGLGMTRRELGAAKTLFEQTLSPVERFDRAMTGLNALLSKGLNVDTYNRSVAKLREEFEATNKQASKFGDLFKAVFGGGVATLAVEKTLSAATSLARGVTGELKNLEDMLNAADKLNVSQRTFAGMEIVSQRADVDFASMTNAFEKMSIKIATAATEGGKAREVFTGLGLDARRLVDMSADQAFLEIAAAIGRQESQMERLATTQDIFGSSNTDMVRMLELTSDSFRQGASDAEKFGLAITGGERSIQRANDAMDTLSNTWKGLQREIAMSAAPAMGMLDDALRIRREASFAGKQQGISDLISRMGPGPREQYLRGLAEQKARGELPDAFATVDIPQHMLDEASQKLASEAASEAAKKPLQRQVSGKEMDKQLAALGKLLEDKGAGAIGSSVNEFLSGRRMALRQAKERDALTDEFERDWERIGKENAMFDNEYSDRARRQGANTAIMKGSAEDMALRNARALEPARRAAEERANRQQEEIIGALHTIEKNTERQLVLEEVDF